MGGSARDPARWPYSPQIYQAFAAMQQAGFTAYCCGDRRAPNVLVAAYDWGGYMDFAPSRAVWHYLGALEPAVAATLQLPPPDHRGAPAATYPAPVTLFVTSHEQRPMTVAPGRHV
jgi:hypothetical protein